MPKAGHLAVCDESSSVTTKVRTSALARLGTSTVFTGVHAALWLEATPVCIAIVSVEVAVAVTIILTALFACEDLSDRAFRMLPWATPPKRRGKRGRLASE